MSPWNRLLEEPHSGGHFVQLGEADEPLAVNVCRYLWHGLRNGGSAVVITSIDHTRLFSNRLNDLGADVPALLRSGKLLICDAHETLARFMVAGQPDWSRFESVIRPALHELQDQTSSGNVRAYGEMVGILWKARQYTAAIRLEQFWNRLLEQVPFSLYCSYAFDGFSDDVDAANLESVLCTHTHLVPGRPAKFSEIAMNKALRDVLGESAVSLRMSMKATDHRDWPVMPKAEAALLWLRRHVPQHAQDIIERARAHSRAAS